MADTGTHIEGHCDARFTAVRTAFEENFAERGELGAAVTVRAGGRAVVDLWGGWADAARTRPWERDTVVNVWSTTKGPTALCAHVLADRGLLDLDAPVASYWPEFASAGKESVLVRHLLSHRSGLAGLREPHTFAQLCDWQLTVARLAATEPWWTPGTRSGYHAMTYGFLVGEVVRRVTGLLPGAFLHQEVTGPYGVDFSVGLPEKEYHRAAELVHAPVASDSEQAAVFAQLEPVALAALANPAVGAVEAGSPEWRAAEIPAANGHGSARAIAELYGIVASGGLLGGRRLLSATAAERIREGQGPCRDLVLGAGFAHDTEVALGLWLSGPNGSYGPNPRAVGHDGFGGSCGLADPEAELSMGYVMNRMGSRIADDPRKMALVEAVYRAL
ncbi:serine hydrolase domain-containing protein [Streptomyces sp. HNM0645]|uniref:serine hydrolase domain-containing protein n=1 Tax=Streptomyces sp. HNM0645 TaxID=2782343 RepID=UPI0024B7431D|nr:serine hydrolase domain-containing protein [Streptomyces sp. HNM0645]MDI9886703.1 serine hydrolase domain-containing protein [Streptomyces sp. HNM0645]